MLMVVFPLLDNNSIRAYMESVDPDSQLSIVLSERWDSRKVSWLAL
jgi:hypothetical protein